ncbi:MAG: peptide deformylase [Clostridia bacterium]
MALRRIVRVGDETLRKVARPVAELNRRMLILLDDMAETMYAENGVGLAAPQVGILRRAIVVDVGEGLYQLINPEIIAREGEQEDMEACLSIPGRRGVVVRPAKITVRATNRKGAPVEIEAEGFLARAFCHEIDHLEGQLFIDVMLREVTEEEE